MIKKSFILSFLFIFLSFSDNNNFVFLELKKGNLNILYDYISEELNLEIENTTKTYSKNQSKQILRLFFQKNKIENFQIESIGKDRNKEFMLGTFSSKQNSFRIYILIETISGIIKIKDIRINSI